MLKNNKILEYLLTLFSLNSENKIEINNSENKQNKIYLRCQKCKQIITLEKKVEKDFIQVCPNCGKKGIIKSKKEVDKKTIQPNEIIQYKTLNKIKKGLNKPILQVKLIGIILIITGIFFLEITIPSNIKLGLTIILIGVLILLLLPDKKYYADEIKKIVNEKNIKGTNNTLYFNKKLNYLLNQYNISEKITYAIIILIVFLYIITGVNNLEIFLIIFYIILIIVKELTTGFIPNYFKKRMNIFIIGFFAIFIIIIIKKIISFVGI